MATVVVDDKGRLLEFVSMPPQVDPDPATAPAALDWARLFTLAGLSLADFKAVPPQWTPRIYAEDRAAWEGPMPAAPDQTIRIEAASYRSVPVSFQVIWPWTRPTRMELPAQATGLSRALSLGGAFLVTALLVGAVMLVRANLKSGRADRRGAFRIGLALLAIWVVAWALGARHRFDINAELGLFFSFFSVALLNTAFTWLFYLALEPFVRRFRPHILISWTRLLAGHARDPLVARDILVGVAAGVFIVLLAGAGLWMVSLLNPGGPPPTPQASNVRYLLGVHHTLSLLFQMVPNALQSAMVATFIYVMLRAFSGRDWVASLTIVALFVAVVVSEESGSSPWAGALFGLALAGPVMFVFLRYGLLSIAVMLLVNQALNLVPLTTDLSRSHAGVSVISVLLVGGLAVWSFQASKAGDGLLRRMFPA